MVSVIIPLPEESTNWQAGPSIPLFWYFSKIRWWGINYLHCLSAPWAFHIFLAVKDSSFPCFNASHLLQSSFSEVSGICLELENFQNTSQAESWKLKMWRISLDHLVHLFPIKEFSRWKIFICWMPPLVSAGPKVRF